MQIRVIQIKVVLVAQSSVSCVLGNIVLWYLVLSSKATSLGFGNHTHENSLMRDQLHFLNFYLWVSLTTNENKEYYDSYIFCANSWKSLKNISRVPFGL